MRPLIRAQRRALARRRRERRPVEARLVTARQHDRVNQLVLGCRVIQRYPYHASLLSRLSIESDPDTPIMAVSARGRRRLRMHVNPGFADAHSGELLGIVLHELNHLIFGHTTDPRFRCVDHPHLMQLAMEASANESIAEPLYGRPITVESLSKWGVKPGQSTFERYEALLEALKSDPELDTYACMRFVEDDGATGHCGVWRRALGQAEPGATLDAAAVVTELLGTDPLPPRRDWRQVLRRFVENERTPVLSWVRPSRRQPARVGEVPGRVRRRQRTGPPRLLVAIDTSSSMSTGDLELIGSELRQLAHAAHMTIVECDTEIRRVYSYDEALPEIVGRGGTDLQPVFEAAFLAEHAPTAVVYFTDGMGPTPERPPPVPTLWVLTGSGEASDFDCPWGERVEL